MTEVHELWKQMKRIIGEAAQEVCKKRKVGQTVERTDEWPSTRRKRHSRIYQVEILATQENKERKKFTN